MKTSAGILLYKRQLNDISFFLVHPGGPFWKNKDGGAWSIPKGEIDAQEDALVRALTEFKEETGQTITGNFKLLTPVQQKSGKWVKAWAVEGDVNVEDCSSNWIQLAWPPRSGNYIDIPEIDRWEWCPSAVALQKINPAQTSFILEVLKMI